MTSYTILLVDDEPGIRHALSRALMRSGYAVLPAATGEEACELLAAHDVDLILLDLRMPGMSGQTLFHIVASRWPHLVPRIVIMSGDPAAEEHGDWLSIHSLPVLSKPFELSSLLDLVQRLTAHKRREANGQ